MKPYHAVKLFQQNCLKIMVLFWIKTWSSSRAVLGANSIILKSWKQNGKFIKIWIHIYTILFPVISNLTYSNIILHILDQTSKNLFSTAGHKITRPMFTLEGRGGSTHSYQNQADFQIRRTKAKNTWVNEVKSQIKALWRFKVDYRMKKYVYKLSVKTYTFKATISSNLLIRLTGF